MTISRERARVEQENADLRAILKQYLDGISVNDDVLNAANPLFVVSSAVDAPPPVKAQAAQGTRRTVVEAAHNVMIPQLTLGRQGASI